MKIKTCIVLLALVTFSVAGSADSKKKFPRISDLSWLQTRQLDRQVQQIDELARQELGMSVRGDMRDLELLQRIIYKGLVKQDDGFGLQALGVVLGNVMVTHLGLEWKNYEDGHGKSRATCVPDSDQCLFPVTMLSRRMEVGLLPDVGRLYDESREMLLAYQEKMKRLHPTRESLNLYDSSIRQ